MSKIKLTLPLGEIPIDGKQVSFVAPCDCSVADGIQIDGVDYDVVDSVGNTVSFGKGVWCNGALLSVILDVTNRKAYLQNQNGYTKAEVLTDATKSMFGLGAAATPNTVFQKLAMPYGYYGFDVTTVFSDGTIAPNIVLEGLEDFSGNTVMTDENGRCPIAVSESQTPSVSISGYLDVEDTTITIPYDDSAVFSPVTITLEKKTVTHELKNSLTARTTGASTYDITVVGGGGGGNSANNGGGGGGGGYISTELNVPITTTTLSVAVGAGGKGGGIQAVGGDGGQSYVTDGDGNTLVSASGGKGAGISDVTGYGGAGNGNGGNIGQTGGNAVGYLFDDESLGVPGGGGGGGTYKGGMEVGVWNQIPGGAPYGGGGGHNYKDANWETHYYGGEAGKGPGGGGGAGNGNYAGGAGAAGAVFMRARFA